MFKLKYLYGYESSVICIMYYDYVIVWLDYSFRSEKITLLRNIYTNSNEVIINGVDDV
jgi:hypothetical protein